MIQFKSNAIDQIWHKKNWLNLDQKYKSNLGKELINQSLSDDNDQPVPKT